jgi:hypothetical protein
MPVPGWRGRHDRCWNEVSFARVSLKPPGWEKQVIQELEQAWKPKLASAFRGLPAGGFPKLAEIFRFFRGGRIIFNQAPGGFERALETSVRDSDPDGSSTVIRALGYPYINGVLRGAGLFDDTDGTGLWVSGDYRGNDWKRGATNPAGRVVAPRWSGSRGKRSNFTATASAVVSLLTLLATRKLVEEPDPSRDPSTNYHDQMLDLMLGRTEQYVGRALFDEGRRFDSLNYKIGIGVDGRSHDCAIVERRLPSGETIRYVVAGFGFDKGHDPVNLRRLFVELDSVVAARH